MNNLRRPTVIIGAGPCGSLLANVLAARNIEVEVFEKKNDLRLDKSDSGRSINLALSDRGLKALSLLNIEDKIRSIAIPMFGRCLHQADGTINHVPYSGRQGEFINSISRTDLNILLLEELDQYENVKTHFNASCAQVDYKNKILTIDQGSNSKSIEYHLLFGTDGVNSAVRTSLFDQSFFSYQFSQHFLDFGYKELILPADDNHGFRIDKNALHIWPRGKFMLIGLPNLDGSFTMTLFLPLSGENSFQTLEEIGVESFFLSHFSDLVPLFPDLMAQYQNHPIGMLGTIKCLPWQIPGNALLMGDACHAVVPFYGQGMNCAFEDVGVFNQLLNSQSINDTTLFEIFQDQRKINTDAIADLAIDNFFEMRDHTADPIFLKKRVLEAKLENTFPDYYSKYSMVTFQEELGYYEAMVRGRKQDEYLMSIVRTNEVDQIDLLQIYKNLKSINF